MRTPGFVTLIFISLFAGTVMAQENQTQKAWWDETPWHDPERGFNWYPPDAPLKKEASTQAQPSIQEMKTLPELKQELERLKSVAVMEPTNANVKAYLEAQTYVMDKSSLFADVARRVVWQNPEIDYNNRSPRANVAQFEKRSIVDQHRAEVLSRLSQDYGLMFFFREDCSYCHIQAPIMRLLEQNYGMPVMAVSLDSSVLPQFPKALPDNGISIMVSGGQGITVTPAVFLVHRATRQSQLIGTGVIAVEEMAERIRVLTDTKPGESF